MRLTIIPSEDKISIDGKPITGCDVSWIPEFVGDITGVSQKVHAVQWYDDHGEIELVSRDNNIVITELGVFEQAITKYEERKLEIPQLDNPTPDSIENIMEQLLREENVGVATT